MINDKYYIILIILIISGSLFCDDFLSIEKLDESYIKKICGVYEEIYENVDYDIADILNNPFVYYVNDFSWGKALYFVNSSLEIDIHKSGIIGISNFSFDDTFDKFKIINENKIILKIIREGEKNPIGKLEEYDVEIVFLDDNKIKIHAEYIGLGTQFEGMYFKLEGPDIKSRMYFKPTVDKLRLREGPDLKSKTIKLLFKGEKLEYITKHFDKGNNVTIDKIEGYWIKIRTQDGKEGYCFSGYLDYFY